VRSWLLWVQPRRVQVTALAVEIAAVALVLTRTGDNGVTAAVVGHSIVLAVLGVVHTELAIGVERLRLLVTRPTHVGLTSVWTFAGALRLPLVFAAAVAVVVQGYVWLRAGEARAPLYKHVFSTASVVLACGAADAVSTVGGGLGPAHIPAALVAYTAVNSLLIAVVVALSIPAPRDPKVLFGDVDDNVLELATLTLGALVALVLAINPWLVALVLPPLLVLHRAVLVGQLEEAASTDGKTGLLNAQTWGARAEHELLRARGADVPHAVLVLDIDHFKAVNDLYGHLAGDQVLAAVATTLRSEVRDRDLVGRFGGEEFVILLVGGPEGGETDPGAIAERIRERVAGLEVDVTTGDGAARISRLSVSVGGALHPGGRAELDGLLRIADTALYSAKRAGRNQVRMGRAQLLTLRDQSVAQDHPHVRPPSP
jgi:diguanylate cyclase (GGDEF)-like protein